MAKFTFQVEQNNDFSISEKSIVSTDCASQYVYEIYSATGDSVSVSLSGDFMNNSTISINGVSEYWDGIAKSISFTGVALISFNIQNSGVASFFNEAELTIEDTVNNHYFNKKFTRENDSPKCGDLAPATTYDQLEDTPENKLGSSLKFVRVNEDETMHEYVSLDDVAKNIYNSDGTLDSDRAVGLNENNLTFSGSGDEEFAVSNLDGFLINNVVNVEINDANGVTINSNSSEITTEDSNNLKMGAISLLMNSNSTTSNEESFKVSFGVTSTTPDNKKGIEYNEDYSLNWDENTPDNLLTTKGYVDRANAGFATESYVDGNIQDNINNLATVARSGDYDDLINKPTIPNTDDFVEKAGDIMSGLLQTPVIREEMNSLPQAGISGNYNIDWSLYSTQTLKLTGNTTLTESNIPTTGYEQTIIVYIEGDFALTLPGTWIVVGGSYDPAGTQFIVQSWDDGNFYCAIGGGEIDLSNYLQKSGGTISGALEINLPSNSVTDSQYLKFKNNGENVGYLEWENGLGGVARITGTKEGSGASSNEGYLSFSTATNATLSEKLRIRSNGDLVLSNIQVFADNTSASSLETGTIYRTSDGTLKIKY